jgi:hypothetical protein
VVFEPEVPRRIIQKELQHYRRKIAIESSTENRYGRCKEFVDVLDPLNSETGELFGYKHRLGLAQLTESRPSAGRAI